MTFKKLSKFINWNFPFNYLTWEEEKKKKENLPIDSVGPSRLCEWQHGAAFDNGQDALRLPPFYCSSHLQIIKPRGKDWESTGRSWMAMGSKAVHIFEMIIVQTLASLHSSSEAFNTLQMN